MVDRHLGGYVPGGDENTMYPGLWSWLVTSYQVRTVLDVGAGDGVAVDHFNRYGAVAVGVDGMGTGHPDVEVHDFQEGPWRPDDTSDFDLVWSCEFVEHMEERYVPNFLEAFRLGKLVLMTHAVPGQGGYHHVNCRTADYWIGAMAAAGYVLDWGLTSVTRELAASDCPGPYPFYAHTGMAFHRTGAAE